MVKPTEENIQRKSSKQLMTLYRITS